MEQHYERVRAASRGTAPAVPEGKFELIAERLARRAESGEWSESQIAHEICEALREARASGVPEVSGGDAVQCDPAFSASLLAGPPEGGEESAQCSCGRLPLHPVSAHARASGGDAIENEALLKRLGIAELAGYRDGAEGRLSISDQFGAEWPAYIKGFSAGRRLRVEFCDAIEALERRLKEASGGDAAALRDQWTGPLQVLKDAKEIASAYGYLVMRMAVAKDAQDAYDISKQTFQESEETLHRLQEALREVPMQRPAAAPVRSAGGAPRGTEEDARRDVSPASGPTGSSRLQPKGSEGNGLVPNREGGRYAPR